MGTFPPYFLRLGEVNRRGPAAVGGHDSLPRMTAAEVARLKSWGAEVVDVRPAADFGAAHVPGSVSIPLRAVFGTWLGWLVDVTVPIVVVRNPDQDPGEILWQARKIGCDRLVGEVGGGIDAWRAAGEPVGSIPVVAPGELADTPVVDVRQHAEFAGGHVPGARHIELGALPVKVAEVPAGPTVVMCGRSERAMSAASVLARAARNDVSVLDGGPGDWANATGGSVEVGT